MRLCWSEEDRPVEVGGLRDCVSCLEPDNAWKDNISTDGQAIGRCRRLAGRTDGRFERRDKEMKGEDWEISKE